MEKQTPEELRQEEDLALKQVCLDRHLSEIASKVERWEVLLLHNMKLNALFEKQFTADKLIDCGHHCEQQQCEFLKLWKQILRKEATYCNLCENFRSTRNVNAENFTRHLSVSSLKEIIKGIITSNHDFFIHELHIDKLINLMRNRGLVTDDDVEIIKDISTEQKRCKHILLILQRSSFTCFQKFVMVLSESSIHGDIVAKILEDLKMNEIDNFLPSLKWNNTSEVSDEATSSRKRKRENDDEKDLMAQRSEHFKPSELSVHFVELLDEITDCLQSCEVPRLITKFNVLMADHAARIPFFPQKLLHKLYKCKTVEDLLLKLSPYISWQRMHILQLVVEASKCGKAKKLLSNFKSKMNETLSIKQYSFPPPSKRIIPAQDSSEAMISTKSVTDDMTLQDANKITKALADSTGTNEHCFELTSTTPGSIILYWLVIRSVIGLVIEGVYSNRSMFYSMGVVEVCIDPGIVITTMPSVRVGSLSYLTGFPTEIEKLSSTITKLNLDLLTNFKPLLASEQSDFKLTVEDLQAKCHTLSHRATADIMTLKEKVKHLEESIKRADEAAKQKLSQIQSDHDDIKSKLSVVETENFSLKTKNKNLVTHISSAKEQAREKEKELEKVKESSEAFLKEIVALKEEKERLEHLEGSKKEEAKVKLSQIQSDHDETESKLSIVKTENLTLKSENKSLISHVFTAKEQTRQKELQLQKANESIEELMKEVTSLREDKMSGEKKIDTTAVHSLDPEKYTSEWRCSLITGVGKIHFGRPDALAIGPNLELLICDYKHQCVFVLDSELNLLNTLGTTGDGRLTHPNGIAVDQDGTIAVSDYRFHQVKKFSLADGKCICSIGAPGQEDGNFDYPRGLAFSSDGLLYVMDWGNSRIQVFNKQNEFEFKFGTRGLGPSEFDHPTRIALDGSDNVYVANYNSSTIGIFTNFGKFITSIPTNKPFAIAVTSTGYIFADDNDKNLINMWNPKYQLIGRFGQEGDRKGEFNSITDMAIGKSGLYVVDGKNKRLQLIEGIDW